MYKIGDEVSYGLHGKCVITGIETKEINDGSVSFYQVRTLKNPITAKNPNRNDPCILIPVSSAQAKGLRPLVTKEEAESILKLLSDSEYHFDLNETWVSKQKKLEESIRKEGAIGLAKVVGHLFIMIKNDAVPPTSLTKFYESIYKILARELGESMGLTTKEIEPLLNRALRNKLHANN